MQREQIGLPQALAGRIAAARARGCTERTEGQSASPPRPRGTGGVASLPSASAPRALGPERFPTYDGSESLAELLVLAPARAELRRFRTLREHLGPRAAETAWRSRIEATEGTLVRVPDEVRCDLVFLRHYNEEGLVRRLDGLAVIPGALDDAPRPDFCPFTGSTALWPAWWASGRWAAGCFAERSRRVDDGFVVPYGLIEFDDMPVSERGNYYPRVPEWWPEVPPGMPVLLPSTVSYRGSELVGQGSHLKDTLWAVVMSDWVARIGATLVHCALRERRLWRLEDQVVRWIRIFLRAIFRDTEVRFFEVDAVLKAHEGLNWDNVSRYRGEERVNWVPYSPRIGGIDWDRCAIRPCARASVIPWGLIESATGVDLSFWRAVRAAHPVLTLESLFTLAEGGSQIAVECAVNTAEGMRLETVKRLEGEQAGSKGEAMSIRQELEASRFRREARNKKKGKLGSTSTGDESPEAGKSKKTTIRIPMSENSESQSPAKRREGQVDSAPTTETRPTLSSSSSSDKVTPALPKPARKSAPITRPRKVTPAKVSAVEESAELKRSLSQARSRIGTLTVCIAKERKENAELRDVLAASKEAQKRMEASIASARASAVAEGAEKMDILRKRALEVLQQSRKRFLAETEALRKACDSLKSGEGSSRAVEVIDVDAESVEKGGSVKSAESAGGVKAMVGQTGLPQTISSGGGRDRNRDGAKGDGGGNGGNDGSVWK